MREKAARTGESNQLIQRRLSSADAAISILGLALLV
jgi:hypothetical protein